jgi:hypothetical protein
VQDLQRDGEQSRQPRANAVRRVAINGKMILVLVATTPLCADVIARRLKACNRRQLCLDAQRFLLERGLAAERPALTGRDRLLRFQTVYR